MIPQSKLRLYGPNIKSEYNNGKPVDATPKPNIQCVSPKLRNFTPTDIKKVHDLYYYILKF